MLNANAQAWVDALRSSKFKQARHALRADDRYCCLGVACELYRESHPEASWDYAGEFQAAPRTRRAGDVLPPRVRDWLGLRTQTGEPLTGRSLISLNDTYRYNFNRIADVID